MKKTIMIVILTAVLLLSSCGAESTIVVYDSFSAYTVGGGTPAGVGESASGGYVFNTREDLTIYDKIVSKYDTYYGHTEKLDYFGTKSYLGVDYQTEIYGSNNYKVYYDKTSQKLVGIRSLSLKKPILQAEGLITEQDFIDYAKTIAKDFINVEAYSFCKVSKEPPKPGHATAYRGDEYIFRKQLSGVDTAECVVVAITPDGAVGEISHRAVDQFKDFEGITLDEKLIDSAVEKAIKVARPKSSGKVEIEEYDYYLMNDGGTLLLYLELASTVTPIDQEATTDPANPVYREEGRRSVGTVAVVPIAEVRNK